MNEDRELTLVQRFREEHHALARMFAIGVPIQMVMRKTGYSRRRLGILLNSPTFQELIASYKSDADAQYYAERDEVEFYQNKLMIASARHLSAHFDNADDEGELIPIDKALKVHGDMADRRGYSKHTVVHHDHTFATLLDKAIAQSNKVLADSGQKLIEGQVVQEQVEQPQPALGVERAASPHPNSPRPPLSSFVKRRRSF